MLQDRYLLVDVIEVFFQVYLYLKCYYYYYYYLFLKCQKLTTIFLTHHLHFWGFMHIFNVSKMTFRTPSAIIIKSLLIPPHWWLVSIFRSIFRWRVILTRWRPKNAIMTQIAYHWRWTCPSGVSWCVISA